MRIPRLYLPGDYQPNQTLALTKEQVHYALTVLRLKSGHPVEAFNGQGLLATGKLIANGRRDADFQIESIAHSQAESPLNTILVQSISRGDRMDYSIQKAVELGVSAIQPIFSERCEVKLQDDKQEKRQTQWQSMVINACEQSGRAVVPPILPIQTYQAWLEAVTQTSNTAKPFGLGLVLDPYANNTLKTLTPPAPDTPIYLLVGPEGGLSESEVAQAVAQGFTAVRLGPRILRTETAGPTILAIMQTLWGDLASS